MWPTWKKNARKAERYAYQDVVSRIFNATPSSKQPTLFNRLLIDMMSMHGEHYPSLLQFVTRNFLLHGFRIHERRTKKATDTHLDITTYRLNRLGGGLSEKLWKTLSENGIFLVYPKHAMCIVEVIRFTIGTHYRRFLMLYLLIQYWDFKIIFVYKYTSRLRTTCAQRDGPRRQVYCYFITFF